MEMTNLQYIQHRIGYTFKKSGLLCQAFTRKSYTEENKKALNNEVLEFYGDKALDFIVMKKMSEYYGSVGDGDLFISSMDEGKLTEIRKKLVCGEMLAEKIRTLDFHKRLILGKSDFLQKIWEQESVQEDLFEAILGAVAIDSNWDIVALTKVVDRMLNPEFYFQNGFDEEPDYVALVQQWYQKKFNRIPMYSFTRGVRSPGLFPEVNEKSKFQCDLSLAPFDFFRALGETKETARIAAAKKAYEYLKKNNLLLSLKDEIGVPDRDRAINQIQELFQKGYIGEPQYIFDETHDKDGNPSWVCECHVMGMDLFFEATSSSKKEAKKDAAHQMVMLYLGTEAEYDEA